MNVCSVSESYKVIADTEVNECLANGHLCYTYKSRISKLYIIIYGIIARIIVHNKTDFAGEDSK